MANNKTSADSIHDAFNAYFNTRVNPNWRALIESIGESDDDIANLIEEVRKQFFISTASRPYIDRLAANYKVSRPKVVGMDDTTLRRYVPILAYQPKQVKAVIDQLLDIFFFKESTTALVESSQFEPFFLKDGWELEYAVDAINFERILFKAEDFTDISIATADEIASAINRQAKYSFATAFENRITKRKFVKIFTKTIGAKGSIEITGGRIDVSLQFHGIIPDAGSGETTQWLITKIGDTTRFKYIGGSPIALDQARVGDNVIIDMPGNSGTFNIININLTENYFEFNNLFSTPGTFDHGLNPNYFVRFVRPERSVIYTRNNRSVVWEVSPGEIIIEMPATPPVVRRELKGSAHLNGMISSVVDVPSKTSLMIENGGDWPNSGQFVLEKLEQIKNRIVTLTQDTYHSQDISGSFDAYNQKYSYVSKTLDISGSYVLNGINPELPDLASVIELTIATISCDGNGVVSVQTNEKHGLKASQSVRIYDVTGGNFNGVFEVDQIVNEYVFEFQTNNSVSLGIGGGVRIEKVGLAESNSKAYLTTALVNTGVTGPYMYDTKAPFVVSSYVGKITTDIKAGNVVFSLNIETPNNIPDEQGFLIFDYGLNTQEGPVRYLYKAAEGTLALDPAYIFQYDHSSGASITAIRRKGAHVMSGLGKEYAFYISDPSAARVILQNLIGDVKSAGVFLRYMVRYPKLYYSAFDVYSETPDNPLD
jgi:hypothetical protein